MVGITTKTRGSLFCENGLDYEALLKIQPREPLMNYSHRTPVHSDRSTTEMINDSSVDVLVDASPTILPDAEPSLKWIRSALDQGKHVVLANKAPSLWIIRVSLNEQRMEELACSMRQL